jgi:hypothetical protein
LCTTGIDTCTFEISKLFKRTIRPFYITNKKNIQFPKYKTKTSTKEYMLNLKMKYEKERT